MRRSISAVLAAIMLALCFSGCEALFGPDGRTEETETYRVYFRSSGRDSVLGYEEIVASPSDNKYELVFEKLRKGPEIEPLRSVFPSDVELLNYSIDEDKITVRLSGKYSVLEGVDRTIANACIVKTLCEFPEISHVIINAIRDNMIVYNSGLLSAEDILMDINAAASDEDVVTLYFADGDYRYLVPDERRIATSEETTFSEKYIVELLLEGPSASQLKRTIPENTRVISVYASGSKCYVNLSNDFLENKPDSALAERMAVYSIVNTMTGRTGIDEVQILIEGRRLNKYLYLSLAAPFTQYKSIVSTGKSEIRTEDISIYVEAPDGESLCEIPTKAEYKQYNSKEKRILEALLSYGGEQGYRNPIPKGTSLLSVSTTDSVCFVNLSEEFIQNNDGGYEAERMSVQSIVTSLVLSSESISSVQILINGRKVNHKNFRMTGPIVPDGSLVIR